jgi:hypothetical protein
MHPEQVMCLAPSLGIMLKHIEVKRWPKALPSFVFHRCLARGAVAEEASAKWSAACAKGELGSLHLRDRSIWNFNLPIYNTCQ